MGMKFRFTGGRRLALIAGVLAFAGALALPAAALAANTATFSGASPKAGSISAVSKPTVSVTVSDRYGIKGTASYSMTLDGKAVKPTVTYARGYGYTRCTMTFKVGSALSSAAHSVLVKVTDLKKKVSSYSWKFTVDTVAPTTVVYGLPTTPDPATITLSATDAGCGVARIYYILDGGPTLPYLLPILGTDYNQSFALGTHTLVYWAVDMLGNVEQAHTATFTVSDWHALPTSSADQSCLAAGCHAAANIQIIHQHAGPSGGCSSTCHKQGVTPSNDCVSCHPAPANHATHLTIVSQATTGTADCTAVGCHGGSGIDVVAVHGGDCATCHDSSDASVTAAVAGGGATCETCHGEIAPHVVPAHQLVVGGACFNPGCHNADVSVIHASWVDPPGCAACHANPDHAASTDCSTCHPSLHQNETAVHVSVATTAGTITCQTCHGSGLETIHAMNCLTCHASTNPNVDAAIAGGRTVACSACHTGDVMTIHAGVDTSHTATLPSGWTCTAAGCHDGGTSGTNVADIHASAETTVDGQHLSSCQICHANPEVATATLDCQNAHCHPDGAPASHEGHPATVTTGTITIEGNAYTNQTCADCHGTAGVVDLQTIHSGCATCHTASGPAEPGMTYDCTQAGCHSSTDTSRTMHGNVDEIHVASLPSTWTATNCVASGCHDQGAYQPVGPVGLHTQNHVTQIDVAGVHSAADGGPGCICHEPGEPLTTDCTVCHDGEPSTHVGHPSGTTTGTITIAGLGTSVYTCSECHATDLQQLHTSCSVCHTDSGGPAYTGMNFTCAQPGCHSLTSGQPMHADITTVHSSADASSCATGSCHGGVANVAAIHSEVPGRSDNGCGICHDSNPADTPTLDCTSVGCHDGGVNGGFPPSTHASHDSTVTTGTIQILGTGYTESCATCHSTDTSGDIELQAVHGGASSCADCHGTGGPAHAGMNYDCSQAGCHSSTDTGRVMHANVDAAHTASLPSTWTATSCIASGCHDYGKTGDDCVNLAAIHASAVETIDGVQVTACGVCHQSGQPLTADCTQCHDGEPADHASHASGITTGTITLADVGAATYSCSECHASTDLQVVHGGASSCADCHGTGKPAHTGMDFTCAQAGCHSPSDTGRVMHANADTLHAASLPSTWTCTVSGCHDGGASGTNVAAIHVSAETTVDGQALSSCQICHENPNLSSPTTDCQNANCHPDGAPSSHQGHPATDVTGTITIEGNAYANQTCADCHGTAGVVDLQAIHSSCATCHGGSDPANGKTTFTCAQTGCHSATDTGRVQHGNVDSLHLASLPSTWTATNCVTSGCHSGADGGQIDVAAIHATANGGPGCICHQSGEPLTTDCTTCHPDGAPADTHGSHDSTVTTGPITITNIGTDTYNCSECHISSNLQQIHSSCATCHGTSGPAQPGMNFDCSQTGCHAADSSQPYHADATAVHNTSAAASCATGSCHGGVANVAEIHSEVPGRSDNGCGICHDSSDVPTMTCTSIGCHDGGANGGFPPSSHASHDSTVTTGNITILGTTYSAQSCNACHSTDTSGDIELQAVHGGSGSCATCHGTSGPAHAGMNYDCTQSGCHSSSDTDAMHPQAILDATHTASLPSTWTGSSNANNCIQSGCHAYGAHSGSVDVAAIHSTTNGGPGCVCHEAGKTLTTDCQTVGCHPGGAAADHGSHLSTVTAGTITINSIGYTNQTCSSCHSTDLQVEHANKVSGYSCATCHPSHTTGLPSGDFDCQQSGCHSSGSTAPMHTTANLNADHTVTQPSCTQTGCHSGGTDIAAIHYTTDVTNKCLTCHNATSAIPSATCTQSGCHDGTSAPAIASYTSTSSATPHPGELTAHSSYTDSECNSCHADDMNDCGGCHGDNDESQYNAPYDIIESFPGDLPAIHAGVQSTNLSGDWNGGHYTNGCLTCHTPGTPAITDCTTCHNIDEMNNDYNNMD